jgi:hypothetical protein
VAAEAASALDATAAARWLDQLAGLLGPLQAGRLVLVGGLVLPMRMQWVDRLPADVQPVVPADAAIEAASGWLIQLEADESDPLLLFVAAAEPGVDECSLRQAAALVRAAWRLQFGAAAGDGPDELAEAIHALRNSLNSVLMSAAVVSTCADLLPERLQPIAREIEGAAARSVQRLHRLTGLIESRS